MSPLPSRMTDRWSGRVQPAPRCGVVYWHLLMSGYPRARAAAAEAQEALARFPGLHMTPREWLHITMVVVGSTDELTREQMSAMVSGAQRSVRGIAPITVSLGKVLYHPEAIMLGVRPSDALLPVFEAVRSATREVTGHDRAIDEAAPFWVPHMTISYSTAEQEATPIISALGKSVEKRTVLINSATLVIQWGPEKLWNWEPVGTIKLRKD